MTQSSGILTDVFERITDAFVALDNNWCYTYMNRKAGEIFQRSPAQMIGKHIWTEFPEGIDQSFYKAYYRAMKEQQYIHVEEYYPPYDKWFENHIYPSADGLSIFFRDITQRKNAEQLNEKIQKENDALINSTRDLLWSVSNDYTLITANGPFVKGLKDNGGFIIKPGDNILSSEHFPEDYLQYWKGIYQKGLSGESVMTEVFTPQAQSSDYLWFELSIEPIFNEDKIIGIACSMRNITERKKMDLILAGEKKVMEMIATEKSLEEILNTIALNYESYSNHAICSILLLNDEGTHISHVAGPNLPDAYNKGIEGEPIGPVAGSCGTAAYRKERVIVTDIATDPLWVNYRDFALSFGLKASWSTPIINTIGKVYGTFAIYYKECMTPDETELVLIDRSVNQVKIVLERYYKDTQIKESEEKYRTLVEQASDAIFIADTAGRFIAVNTSACKLSQYSEMELLQMSIHDFAVMEDIQREPFHFDELKQGKTVITERLMRRRDSSMPNVEITAKLLSDGRLLTFIRDITERKKAEAEIENTAIQLRQLTTYLQTIRDEERKRIGREIHDELGQQLTAIKMDVAWIDKKTPSSSTGNEDAAAIKTKLKNIIHLLDGGNESVRKILNELRPGVLDDYGLVNALVWQGRKFKESTGIAVEFTSSQAEIKLPQEIANCLFRVYQESLTNIMRYAEANKVLTSLSIQDDNIMLTVHDNGKGFDMTTLHAKKSFGILGMKERVLSLNGKFELKSAPEKGTEIIISIPYTT